uniref:Uncharacterized protein n=1 Tax=Russula subnigricans TaxID=258989 RepID=A0A649WHZ9_9AGAM|nr:hypothetical protein [Russula subnigricans]QGK88077.1 hypothetical protein [Russula subnigricans]
MKNLNKYTKADLIKKLENLQNKFNKDELINRLEKLESKKDEFITKIETNKDELMTKLESNKNSIKTYFLQAWNLILTFKDILLKLTFISLIIQFFRKYKFFRRIWIIINSIVLAIFGISLYDNSMFDFINNLFAELRFISWNIVDYLSNTKFYQYLTNLFSKTPIIDRNEISEQKSAPKTPKIKPLESEKGITYDEWSQRQARLSKEHFRKSLEEAKADIERKTKLSEWLKPQQEIIENKEISSETNYKKYLIITGIILSSALIYYYSDEVKAGVNFTIQWFLSFRSRRDNNPTGNSDSNTTINPTNTVTGLDSEEIIPDIELTDIKGKNKTLFKSPSLEEFSSKVTDYWSKTPSSPESSSSSTSSSETITPSSLNIGSSSSSTSTENITPSDIVPKTSTWFEKLTKGALDELVKLLEGLDPDETINKMLWIENNLKDINNDLNIKNQIIDKFKEIQLNNSSFIDKFEKFKSQRLITDTDKLIAIDNQLKTINKWIDRYSKDIIE